MEHIGQNTEPAPQATPTIAEFNRRAIEQPDLNSVLDATNDPVVRHSNTYRDYLTRRALVRLLRPKSTDVILDFGCGVGRLAKEIYPLVKTIEGVDGAVEMIRVANQQNLPNVHFSHLKSPTLPFSSNTFTKIFTCGVLLHLRDDEVKHALQEFRRVLEPAGSVVCIEQTKLLADASISPGFTFTQRTIQQYTDMFANAGFSGIRCIHVIRHPSYGMHLWKKLRGLRAAFLLPTLAALEGWTVGRKPEIAEYYWTAVLCVKN